MFYKIYEKGTWGQGSIRRPLSGPGSTSDNAIPYFRQHERYGLGAKKF